MKSKREEIAINKLIDAFNNASLYNDLEPLDQLIHPDAVFLSLQGQSIRGKKLCMDSIRAYNDVGQTLEFKRLETTIEIWDSAAAVLMEYKVRYLMNDKVYHERTKEHWIVLRRDQKWLLCWRMMISTEQLYQNN